MSSGPIDSGPAASGPAASGPASTSYSSTMPRIDVTSIPSNIKASLLSRNPQLRIPDIRTPFSSNLKVIQHILELTLNDPKLPDNRTVVNSELLTVFKSRLEEAASSSARANSSARASGAAQMGGRRRRSRSQRGGATASANPTVVESPANAYLSTVRRRQLANVSLTEDKINSLTGDPPKPFMAGATKSVLFNQQSLEDVKRDFLSYKASVTRDFEAIKTSATNEYARLTTRLNGLDETYRTEISTRTEGARAKLAASQEKKARYEGRLATAKTAKLKESLEKGIKLEEQKIDQINIFINTITNRQNRQKQAETVALEKRRTELAQVFAIAEANTTEQTRLLTERIAPFEAELNAAIQQIPAKLSEIQAKLSSSGTTSSTSTIPPPSSLPPPGPSGSSVSGPMYGGRRRRTRRQTHRRRRH